MSAIEALYIYDEHNTLLLDHIYTGRPPPASTLLSLYLQHPTPRSSLIHLSSLNPPCLCYSIIQDNILFLSPTTTTPPPEPLLILEFLHRVADALQEFLGTPLLSTKITASYDILSQILTEIADGGVIAQSEPNALRDVVETGPGVLKNLLGSFGAGGSSPALSSTGAGAGPGLSTLRPQHVQPQSLSVGGSAIPWRRSNVRHTSNELYVDIVEELSVTLAPSGRPLAAFAQGSVLFNCKVSGVPDLLLTLTTGGLGGGMGTRAEQLQRVMERVVFHPCVRLNKWKSEGVLSFVPPDGRFALCGYEVDLLGAGSFSSSSPGTASGSVMGNELGLPVTLDVATNLGPNGAEFEVRVLSPASQSARGSAAAASLQSHLSSSSSSSFSVRSKSGTALASTATSTAPALEDLTVHVPLPAARIRNLSELRPSKGEAHWNPAEGVVEWTIPGKEFAAVGAGGVVLRCTIQGITTEEEGESGLGGAGAGAGVMNGFTTTTTYDYDDDYNDEVSTYQSQDNINNNNQAVTATTPTTSDGLDNDASQTIQQRQQTRQERNKDLMPTSATLSFSLKGSLPSGLRVESLLVDNKKSKGLGQEVKPYKGVKYLTVSRGGVEVRC